MYKLLVIDLDNTTLKSDKSISKKNMQAIKECMKNNIMVSIASGRPPADVGEYVKMMSLEESIHTGDNGSTVFKLNDWTKVTNVIADEDYIKIASFLEENNIDYGIFKNGNLDFLYWDKSEIIQESIKKFFLKTKVLEHDVLNSKGVYKICIYYKNEEELSLCRDMFKNLEVESVIADKGFLDVMGRGTTKFSGVMQIADILGIVEEEIAFVGDQENDLPAIIGSGLGVCVNNAVDSVKEHSDVILKQTNNEDAIYHLVYDYILS